MSYKSQSFKLHCEGHVVPKKQGGSNLIFASINVRCFQVEYLEEANELLQQLQGVIDGYNRKV